MSAQVRQSVFEAAENLNYVTPAQRKRKVNARKSNRVGLLHALGPEEEMRDPYYVALRLGVERRCAELDLDPKLFQPADFHANPKILADMMGVILVGWYRDETVQRAKQVCDNTVVADFTSGVSGVDSVSVDLVEATREVMNCVLDKGFTQIAFLGWEGTPSLVGAPESGRRVRTFREMLSQRSLLREELIRFGDKSEAAGFEIAMDLLSLDTPPEVIVTANDTLAVGVYRAVHERGLTMASDVSVVSFNDVSIAKYLVPPLTTVHIPKEDIGASAVDLLVERQKGRQVAKHLKFETHLQWRGSLGQVETSK